MPSALMKLAWQVVEQPVYVVIVDGPSYIVDKLTTDEKQKTERKRYFLSAGRQCTCLGWLKTKHCKHLEMVHGKFTSTGVGPDLAIDEAKRIVELVGKQFPEAAKTWIPDMDSLPSKVTSMEFTFPFDNPGVERLIWEKTFASGKLAISFKPIPTTKSE